MSESNSITRNEQVLNEDLITKIADETHKPVPVVQKIYEEEFMHLKANARILEYVTLFASRHTREILSGRRAPRSRTQAPAHA